MKKVYKKSIINKSHNDNIFILIFYYDAILILFIIDIKGVKDDYYYHIYFITSSLFTLSIYNP